MSAAKAPCAHDGCDRDARTKGYCQKHYLRLWRHGTTDTKERLHGVPAEQRFWAHVTRGADDECWPYSPVSERDGYGRINVHSDGQAAVLAHRYAYELMVGPIPDGLQIDHQCHEPDSGCVSGPACPHRACVNPAHLRPSTNRENSLRGNAPSIMASRNDLCEKGLHRFSEVGWRQVGDSRWCGECARIWYRNNYHANKAVGR